VKRGTNSANLLKTAQGIGYAPAGRLYSAFWSNLSKNFSFGVLYPYRCTDGGEIWHGGGSMPNFTPSVQRVAPPERKTSKSAYE